jgi:23S rRNA (cytidine1920-2'-O)/16S rRNA (cytidine1409-2'-O)-methyltransferase
MKRTRLDVYLTQQGLSPTREKAKRDILAGWVKVDGETVTAPARTITGTERVTVSRPGGLYVSRGGIKLAHGLKSFGVDLTGRVAADLGASTGGFTDCMLKSGAVRVYAVDVGYGQIDYSLKTDARVVIMDKTNVRKLKAGDFPEKIDFVAADLSFVSILKIFSAIQNVFAPVEGILLIKPQFEAGPGEHKKGVVRKKEAHTAIMLRTVSGLVNAGLFLRGLVHSPVKGPKGNIEFLLYFICDGGPERGTQLLADQEALVRDAVDRAHAEFDGLT